VCPPVRTAPHFQSCGNGCGFSEKVSWNKRSIKEMVKQDNSALNANKL
jgi:hypothetical protein